MDSLLGTMLHASRDLQSRLRVAVQGGQGSWSEISFRANVPDVEVLHCETVRDVEEACRSGRAVAAWLPRYNSTIGCIAETDEAATWMDGWLRADHPIRHALIGPAGLDLVDAAIVRGHPKALAQCAATLARSLPNARLEATVDGAHSASTLEPSAKAVVVAPPEVADRHGLRILACDVQDMADNTTTFELLVPKETY